MQTPKAFSLVAAITLLNVLVASAFSVTGLTHPELILRAGAAANDASNVFALYAAARTLPLAGAVIWAVAVRSSAALMILGSLAGVVQAADAIVGLLQHDAGKTAGPLILACLQAYAVLPYYRV